MHTGSCLCGRISFEIVGDLPPVEGCHCTQCRRWTGHFLASIDVPRSGLAIRHPERVSWFHSSEKVRRGFCPRCGSPLFFDPLDTEKHDWIGVAMGALDQPTGTSMGLQIFVAEKGDYYEIDDRLPQNEH